MIRKSLGACCRSRKFVSKEVLKWQYLRIKFHEIIDLVYPEKNSVRVKNFNSTPLVQAEGFWSNNPLIYNRHLYGLQNVTDQQDELTAIAD